MRCLCRFFIGGLFILFFHCCRNIVSWILFFELKYFEPFLFHVGFEIICTRFYLIYTYPPIAIFRFVALKKHSMKKTLLLLSAIVFVINFSNAQTTAQDWTKTDCNGISHQLFTELDNGNCVILAFDMLPSCSLCINAAYRIRCEKQRRAEGEP